jgi:hypothetical protein
MILRKQKSMLPALKNTQMIHAKGDVTNLPVLGPRRDAESLPGVE